jgi:glycosyltransferase involved in cell wall biosynthesis
MSKRVTVITPTTGSHYLEQNVKSVSEQTYDNVEHLVVIDGKDFSTKAMPALVTSSATVLTLPHNTGHSQYNGHRIYGAVSYLVDSDYVMFLDEDNWIAPNHVESLVKTIEEGNDWAFSLRKIYDGDGNFICLDDCENLGLWPTCISEQELFVDVGAYFLPTPIAVQISPLWYRRARHPDDQPEVDRIIMQTLLSYGWSYDTNGKYTLNYRVGNREDSVKSDFFLWGNAMMEKKYPNSYPWRKI